MQAKGLWFQNDKKATEAAYSLHFYDYSLIIFVVIGKTPELMKFIHRNDKPRQVSFHRRCSTLGFVVFKRREPVAGSICYHEEFRVEQ